MWKILNKLKYKLIEIMTIGKDMEEIRNSALKMAQEETDEEFKRRYENYSGQQLFEINEGVYNNWLDKNREDYNNMIKELYNKYLLEMKRMCGILNI